MTNCVNYCNDKEYYVDNRFNYYVTVVLILLQNISSNIALLKEEHLVDLLFHYD